MQTKMNHLQLPKNKFARLGINIFIVVFWYFLSSILYFKFEYFLMDFNSILWSVIYKAYVGPFTLAFLLFFIIPSFLVSRLIWFGRILPRPKITRSKD